MADDSDQSEAQPYSDPSGAMAAAAAQPPPASAPSAWDNFKLGLAGIGDALGITDNEAAQLAAAQGTGTVASNTAAEDAGAVSEAADQTADQIAANPTLPFTQGVQALVTSPPGQWLAKGLGPTLTKLAWIGGGLVVTVVAVEVWRRG